MKNKIEDLRNHLFETLEGLRDEEKPMDIERAKAVVAVAQVLVDSAKVEVQFLSALNERRGTGFIPQAEVTPTERRLTAVAGGRGRD